LYDSLLGDIQGAPAAALSSLLSYEIVLVDSNLSIYQVKRKGYVKTRKMYVRENGRYLGKPTLST
jgi:hypothetical protein